MTTAAPSQNWYNTTVMHSNQQELIETPCHLRSRKEPRAGGTFYLLPESQTSTKGKDTKSTSRIITLNTATHLYILVTGTYRQTITRRDLGHTLLLVIFCDIADIVFLQKAWPFEVHFSFSPQSYPDSFLPCLKLETCFLSM